MYDGKTGEKMGQLGESSNAHKGGIYGVSTGVGMYWWGM